MKALLIAGLSLLCSLQTIAQKQYVVSKDDQTGATIFKGPINFDDLSSDPSFTWYAKGMSTYTPDSDAVHYLRKELPAFTVVILMGTWCDDSQLLIPRLSKVLDLCGFPKNKTILYGVDRAKETGGMESRIYEVKKVPTIILYKGNREVGRIVESVKRNIESDLAQMIELDNTHN